MRITDNIEYDIKAIHESIQEIQVEGNMPYGIVMHPHTFHNLCMSESMKKYLGNQLPTQERIIMYVFSGLQFIGDIDMMMGDYDIVYRK